MSEPEYLSTKEAAAIIKMSVPFVSRECAKGNLPATKLGRDWRITRKALDDYMSPVAALPDAPRRRAS